MIFDTLILAYAKFYKPSENWAMDEAIVKLKGRVIFRQCIPKKRNILVSKFANRVTNRVTRMMCACTGVRT
jgi:hypothetical protein